MFPISLSILRVTVQDLDGDAFNWTITTSPNIGGSSGTSANNGTKNCSLIVKLVLENLYMVCEGVRRSSSGQTRAIGLQLSLTVIKNLLNLLRRIKNQMHRLEDPTKDILIP